MLRMLLMQARSPGVSWTPASLTGTVLRAVASPTYCFSDAGGTVPCGDGDGIYVWKLANDTTKQFVQATSGNRPLLKLTGGVWQAQFTAASAQYIALSAALSLTWKSLAIRYADGASGSFAGPFGTSFAPNAVYCWGDNTSTSILNTSFSEADSLSASCWVGGLTATQGTAPPTRTTGSSTTMRNLVIARSTNASRNEAVGLGADLADAAGRCINGRIQELILCGAVGAPEVALLQTYWGT